MLSLTPPFPLNLLFRKTAFERPTGPAIKAQFRSLSKLHHPDKGGSPDAFTVLNGYHDRLLNEDANVEEGEPSYGQEQWLHYEHLRQHGSLFLFLAGGCYAKESRYLRLFYVVSSSLVVAIATYLIFARKRRLEEEIQLTNDLREKAEANRESDRAMR